MTGQIHCVHKLTRILSADSIPKAFAESLSYLPYLIVLEALRKFPANTEAGRVFRAKAQEVGLLQLVLQCLSLASHHSPRVEGEGPDAAGSSDTIPLEDTKYVYFFSYLKLWWNDLDPYLYKFTPLP